MKKNLRIVSVAAAALLAVAPVAASAVSVNADAVSSANNSNLGNNNNGTFTVLPLNNGATVNVKPNISLNTSAYEGVKANVSVSFSATVDGTTATSNFTPNASTIELWKNEKDKVTKVTDLQQVTSSNAGATYQVKMTSVGLNFGSQNANKKITLTFPAGDMFKTADSGSKLAQSHEVQLDKNGTTTLPEVVMNVTAKDFANPALVTWHNRETGANVNTGDVSLYAGSDAGKMNVAQVVSAAEKKYVAGNWANPESSHISVTTNIEDALKAAGSEVDPQGWFTAPKSFTFNMTAKANNNDASSTLAVTVSVPNGKDMTPATVPSQSKTVMHNAYFYDKDAKRVGTDKVTRYNTVTVATSTTTINGKAYYEVVENGKLSGKFINADNIDGTKRTLKHNAYVYRSSKKRANKVVLKKGETVTTYGGSYTFKNGKKYYKIGNDTKKTYVKVANFD